MFVTCGASQAVVLGLLVVLLPESSPGAPGPEEIIASYEKSLAVFRRVELKIAGKEFFRGGFFPEETPLSEWTRGLRRDGERWKVSESGWAMNVLRGKPFTNKIQTEYVLPGEGMIYAQREADTLLMSGALQSGARGVLPPQVYLGSAALLLGYLEGDNLKDLPELLRRSKLSVRQETLEGVKVWVVEGRGEYGLHSLWVDPAIGFQPRRIEVYKTGTDLFGDQPINTLWARGGLDPEAALRAYRLVVDGFQYRQQGAVFVPVAFRQVNTQEHEGAGPVTRRVLCTVTEGNLNPDTSSTAFAVTMAIPNGTSVNMLDSPSIVYQWSDGQVVKVVNPQALSAMEGLTFRQGFSWRLVLIVASMVGILALLAYLSLQPSRKR